MKMCPLCPHRTPANRSPEFPDNAQDDRPDSQEMPWNPPDLQPWIPLLLRVGTGGLLLGLATARQVEKTLIDLGKISEEIFRDDQLPFLKFPRKES